MPGQKITVISIFFSLLLYVIERSNDQNPHPGDTHHSQIPVGCPPPRSPLGLDIDRCITSDCVTGVTATYLYFVCPLVIAQRN